MPITTWSSIGFAVFLGVLYVLAALPLLSPAYSAWIWFTALMLSVAAAILLGYAIAGIVFKGSKKRV